VYPLIDESEALDLGAAVAMAKQLQQDVFPEWRLGLLHGRLPVEEREAIMRAFKEGTLDIVVCTTVIEVGVDVPNATVMVIENAERFGLAQGTKQSGLPELQVGNLLHHGLWLEQARGAAFILLEADPTLSQPAHRALLRALQTRWHDRLELAAIG
jgi:RecG-like helicase